MDINEVFLHVTPSEVVHNRTHYWKVVFNMSQVELNTIHYREVWVAKRVGLTHQNETGRVASSTRQPIFARPAYLAKLVGRLTPSSLTCFYFSYFFSLKLKILKFLYYIYVKM